MRSAGRRSDGALRALAELSRFDASSRAEFTRSPDQTALLTRSLALARRRKRNRRDAANARHWSLTSSRSDGGAHRSCLLQNGNT